MSTILNTQKTINTNNFKFYIEKPTQSLSKQVIIEQNHKELKISLKENTGKIHQVEKDLVEGLPKMNQVPKEYFESCSANVKKLDNEIYKVSFCPRILGGMMMCGITFAGLYFDNIQIQQSCISGIYNNVQFNLQPGNSVQINGHLFTFESDRNFKIDCTLRASPLEGGGMTIYGDIS